jgi:hypothetical protein
LLTTIEEVGEGAVRPVAGSSRRKSLPFESPIDKLKQQNNLGVYIFIIRHLSWVF